jgi:hypothetical protein
MGIDSVDDEAIVRILDRVKTKGIEKRGLITDDEFREIVNSVVSQPA